MWSETKLFAAVISLEIRLYFFNSNSVEYIFNCKKELFASSVNILIYLLIWNILCWYYDTCTRCNSIAPWKSYNFCCVSLGTLERHETGETARAILAAIEDSEYLVADALLPVSQESKQNKNSGYKQSSLYKHGMGPYFAHTEKSSDKVRAMSGV